jgi:hypothetical protein
VSTSSASILTTARDTASARARASASRRRRGRCSSSDRASSARGWARCSKA